MEVWTSEELNKIGKAEELQIASLKTDGRLTKAVTIWVVRVDDSLYVRAYKGRTSPWFRATQLRHEGRISAGGIDKDVTFVEVDNPKTNDQIDAEYRSKYGNYEAEYVDPMLAVAARSATIKLVPR